VSKRPTTYTNSGEERKESEVGRTLKCKDQNSLKTLVPYMILTQSLNIIKIETYFNICKT
jgi:hypothetical protein